MERGDLVTRDGLWYAVVRVSEGGDVLLLDTKDDVTATREDNPKYTVEANPYREWPFIVLPSRFSRLGELKGVSLPSIQTSELRKLEPFQQWFLGEPLRQGGALYLNPTLELKSLERVVLFYQKGQTSAVVPREFLSVAQKALASKFAKIDLDPKHKTVYDHLLNTDTEDD